MLVLYSHICMCFERYICVEKKLNWLPWYVMKKDSKKYKVTFVHCFDLYWHIGIQLCKGTSYSWLLSMVSIKLAFHREDCDVKLKTLFFMSLIEKFLHTIESNRDLEVTFDKYVTVWHTWSWFMWKWKISIYWRREDEYVTDVTHIHHINKCIILATLASHIILHFINFLYHSKYHSFF